MSVPLWPGWTEGGGGHDPLLPILVECTFQPVNETQRQYIFCDRRFACWDGGVWTGKTSGLILRGHLLNCLYPGNRGAIFRYTEEDLFKTVKASFRKMIAPAFYDPKHGGRDVENLTRYINGSEILWMHLKDLNMKALMSLELGWFGISQAEECEASTYEMLETRLRWRPAGWPEDGYFPQYGFIECNPNGKDWIYYTFHPEEAKDPENHAYFFTQTEQNGERLQKQNPDYYQTLLKKPESWKRKYFYGSREVSEGSWHKGFSTKIHCYWPPDAQHRANFNPHRVAAVDFDLFVERKIRAIYAFYDYGLAAETAMEWVAIDSEGFSWFFKEWYGIKETIEQNAFQLLQAENLIGGPVSARYADPSIFFETRRDQLGALLTGNRSIADEYMSNGMTFTPADNNQATGYEAIEEGLRVDPGRINPLTGEKGSPLWFFSMRCPNLIGQIEQQKKKLRRNPISGETEYVDGERATGIPDHAYDCLVYRANLKVNYVPYSGPMPRPMTRYLPSGARRGEWNSKADLVQ